MQILCQSRSEFGCWQTKNSLTEKGTDDDVWQDKRFALIIRRKKEAEKEKD